MNQEKSKYELVVVGAGPAGNKIARAAGKRGTRVVLVERDRLGGTCLNYGCDPTKTMYHCAEVAQMARQSEQFGVNTGHVHIDFPKIMAHVDSVVGSIRGTEPDGGLGKDGVEWIRAEGKFTGPHTMQTGGREIEADRFVIASGASAAIPPIEGLDQSGYLTNRTIFDLTRLPRRLLILGGGAIGCEFAQIFSRLGSTVTLVELDARLMRTEEPEMSAALQIVLEQEGINVFTRAKAIRIVKNDERYSLVVELKEREQELPFDNIFIAAGRTPNIEELNLDAAGVNTNKQGIIVNDELLTNVSHIWACGDVIGRHRFTHVAAHHAQTVIQNVLDDAHNKVDESAVPWGIFTDPEIAHVGLTEAEARERGYEVKTAAINAGLLPRARTSGKTFGFGKIVADAESKQVLGANLICYQATEIIQELTTAMQSGITADRIADVIHVYPTMSQAIQILAGRSLNHR